MTCCVLDIVKTAHCSSSEKVLFFLDIIHVTSGGLLFHIAVFNVKNFCPNFPRRVNRLASDQRFKATISKVWSKGPLRETRQIFLNSGGESGGNIHLSAVEYRASGFA